MTITGASHDLDFIAENIRRRAGRSVRHDALLKRSDELVSVGSMDVLEACDAALLVLTGLLILGAPLALLVGAWMH